MGYDGMYYGLTKFKTFFSDDGTLKAEVWHFDRVGYGIRVYRNQSWILDEHYQGKSLHYAEDAAENVAIGIKPVSTKNG